MNSNTPATIQEMRHLQALVETIDELLELRAVSHHDYLRVLLPKGLLHWPTVVETHVTDIVFIEMGVMGTSLEITITPRDTSDTSNAQVETLKFDRDKGESVYAINGAFLATQDIRALIAYLISGFWPCSLSITERE